MVPHSKVSGTGILNLVQSILKGWKGNAHHSVSKSGQTLLLLIQPCLQTLHLGLCLHLGHDDGQRVLVPLQQVQEVDEGVEDHSVLLAVQGEGGEWLRTLKSTHAGVDAVEQLLQNILGLLDRGIYINCNIYTTEVEVMVVRVRIPQASLFRYPCLSLHKIGFFFTHSILKLFSGYCWN